jgi:hypothetical protein
MSSTTSTSSSSREPSPVPEAAPAIPIVISKTTVLTEDDVPTQVKEDLREYLDLKEQIKGANEELKVFKERLKELSGDISQYMNEHGIDFFNTRLGQVTFYKSKAMTPLNKDFVKKAFESNIPDRTLATELTNIFEKRPFTEVSRIKILPPKRRTNQ